MFKTDAEGAGSRGEGRFLELIRADMVLLTYKALFPDVPPFANKQLQVPDGTFVQHFVGG